MIVLAAEQTNANSQVQFFLFIALMFGAMYFLMIRPQQKRRRQFMELLSSLEVGDEIETIAGIFGTIRKLDDENAWVEIAAGTTVKMSRAAIRRKIIVEEESDAS